MSWPFEHRVRVWPRTIGRRSMWTDDRLTPEDLKALRDVWLSIFDGRQVDWPAYELARLKSEALEQSVRESDHLMLDRLPHEQLGEVTARARS
jgi:hypothetical protein